MTVKNKVGMPHSVHQRLINKARTTGRPFGELLQYYAMERFLDRLTKTEYGGDSLLKGALMLRVWGGRLHAPP